LRWELLRELAAGDRQVQELTGRLGQPQSLVSYHLGQLRKAGLVSGRRSSADGRDTYYRLELASCAGLLAGTGEALHPALRMVVPAPPSATHYAPARVLFLCTGNSARSQMAEAFLRHGTAGALSAYSAGSRPKPVHPHAVTVMAEYGIDLTGSRAKHLDTFIDDVFDVVITLCDRLREVCPEFPGDPRSAHWSLPDPAGTSDGYSAFRRVAAEISERVGYLQHTLTVPATTTLEES
jgi:protein-tyrosine-phosphatase